jgi:hypothetical protein
VDNCAKQMPDADLWAAVLKHNASAKRKRHEHSWQPGLNLVTGSGGYSKEQLQHGQDGRLDWECLVCTKSMRDLGLAHTGPVALGYRMCCDPTCEAITCSECELKAIMNTTGRSKRSRK